MAVLVWLVYLVLLGLHMVLDGATLGGTGFPLAPIDWGKEPPIHGEAAVSWIRPCVVGSPCLCSLAVQRSQQVRGVSGLAEECFPWTLVKGEPCILPLLVVSDSSRVSQQDSSSIWDRNEPCWAPLSCEVGSQETPNMGHLLLLGGSL